MKNGMYIGVLLLLTSFTYAQETVSTSGSKAFGSGGSSNYTIGQLVSLTATGSGTVFTGVQQSVNVLTLSNKELKSVQLNAVVYPNPSSNFILLEISDSTLTDLSFVLYNIHGQLIRKGLLNQSSIKISVQQLLNGIYILKVKQNNQDLKTFKIIKK